VFKTPSVGGGTAVLRDAVGAFFELEVVGGALVDFGEVGIVGLPARVEGGDFGGDDVVGAGEGEVAEAHGFVGDPGWVDERVGEGGVVLGGDAVVVGVVGDEGAGEAGEG